jgi:hypothetical protein
VARRRRRTRQGLLAAGAASCAVAAGSLPWAGESAAAGDGAAPPVFVETTGDDSERVEMVPITRGPALEPRVVMSLGPSDLPRLERGDTLKVFAEVQTTNTCVVRSVRCVGRPYEFSPFVVAKLVLAAAEGVTGGRRAVSLARSKSVHCAQQRPHRNHHCVLTFRHARKRIRNPEALPCAATRCVVNLVVSAHNRQAVPGNVIVIGADQPDGSILQDKGRLSVVLTKPGSAAPTRSRTAGRVHDRVPVTRGDDWTSVYSIKLSNLRPGDVLVATAKQRTGMSSVPYNVFIGSRIILAGRPGAGRTNGLSGRVSSQGGQFTEGNGFNCTQGRSAYEAPCTSRKVGLLEIRRVPRRGGREVPMFVNLVCHTRPKLAPAQSGDHVDVLARGNLKVRKYAGG